ncbi:hypothetical protein ABSL23_17345 (plasmid) [Halobacterium sp. NMX12-1]|uniref:Uncharacterized protein n=1 Tax=Halobacterium sp. NMX12-1 TaxID=3166650 RepID=A0AAU8CHU3_9EURY
MASDDVDTADGWGSSSPDPPDTGDPGDADSAENWGTSDPVDYDDDSGGSDNTSGSSGSDDGGSGQDDGGSDSGGSGDDDRTDSIYDPRPEDRPDEDPQDDSPSTGGGSSGSSDSTDSVTSTTPEDRPNEDPQDDSPNTGGGDGEGSDLNTVDPGPPAPPQDGGDGAGTGTDTGSDGQDADNPSDPPETGEPGDVDSVEGWGESSPDPPETGEPGDVDSAEGWGESSPDPPETGEPGDVDSAEGWGNPQLTPEQAAAGIANDVDGVSQDDLTFVDGELSRQSQEELGRAALEGSLGEQTAQDLQLGEDFTYDADTGAAELTPYGQKELARNQVAESTLGDLDPGTDFEVTYDSDAASDSGGSPVDVSFTDSGRGKIAQAKQDGRAALAAATSGSGEMARTTDATDFGAFDDAISRVEQAVESENPGMEAGEDFTVGIDESGGFTVSQTDTPSSSVENPPGTPRSRAGATGNTGDNLPESSTTGSSENVTGLAGVVGLDAQTVRDINEASQNVVNTVFTGDGYGDSGLPGPELSLPGGEGALFGTITSKDSGSVNTEVTDALTQSGGFLTESQEQDLRVRANRLSSEYAFIGDTLQDTVSGVTGSEKAGRFAGSFGDVVGNLPANVDRGILAAETGVETVQNSPDVGAADTIAAVGSVTGALTKQTVQSAQKNPYQFAGEIAGGAALGTAAFKSFEKAGDISRSVSLTGRETVDYSDITDEAGVRGELPGFDTDSDAPTREAVDEIRTKASDNPDAATEGTGGDSTLYHGTQAEFDADLEVGEGASELPGLFTSPEASPIALQGSGTGWPSPTLKPRLPSIGGKSDRFVGLPGDDVRGMPEDATGAGYAVKQGDDVVESGLGRGEAKARASDMDDAEVAPDPTTSGYEFLMENAEAGAAYVRPEGGRTTELESIFPPESEFTKTGTVAVRVGRKQFPGTDADIPGTGRKVPLDLFERDGDTTADSSSGEFLEDLDEGGSTTAAAVSRDLDRLGGGDGSVAAGGAYTGGAAASPFAGTSAENADAGATGESGGREADSESSESPLTIEASETGVSASPFDIEETEVVSGASGTEELSGFSDDSDEWTPFGEDAVGSSTEGTSETTSESFASPSDGQRSGFGSGESMGSGFGEPTDSPFELQYEPGPTEPSSGGPTEPDSGVPTGSSFGSFGSGKSDPNRRRSRFDFDFDNGDDEKDPGDPVEVSTALSSDSFDTGIASVEELEQQMEDIDEQFEDLGF